MKSLQELINKHGDQEISEEKFIETFGIEVQKRWKQDLNNGYWYIDDYFAPHNPIDKPNHYIGIEGLEMERVLRNFIPRYEDSYVGHRVASAMEYLVRAPLKNGLEDLKKARYNLDQAINHIEGENNED